MLNKSKKCLEKDPVGAINFLAIQGINLEELEKEIERLENTKRKQCKYGNGRRPNLSQMMAPYPGNSFGKVACACKGTGFNSFGKPCPVHNSRLNPFGRNCAGLPNMSKKMPYGKNLNRFG